MRLQREGWQPCGWNCGRAATLARHSLEALQWAHASECPWDEKTSAARYVRDNCKPLKRYMQTNDAEHAQLFDLIQRMLEYEPTQRITLKEALRHPFFRPLGKDGTAGTHDRSHSLSR